MSSPKPLVSVVIPVFNGASFVAKAVQSVRNQTVQDVEIIVVDDGSTDGTQEILMKLERGAGIHMVSQEHQGSSVARNTGIQHARGAFIAFLDCDDVWLPEKLARQLDYFQKHPEVGLVYTDFEVVGKNGVIHERALARNCRDPLVRAFVGGHCATMSTFLVRSDVVRKAGGFNPAIYFTGEDCDFFVRVYRMTEFGCIDEVLARILRHGPRDTFFDFERHRDLDLSGHARFLNDLEKFPQLSMAQRVALNGEWANYYLRRGRTEAILKRGGQARSYYWQAIKKAPFRFRCYSRLIRTMLK